MNDFEIKCSILSIRLGDQEWHLDQPDQAKAMGLSKGPSSWVSP